MMTRAHYVGPSVQVDINFTDPVGGADSIYLSVFPHGEDNGSDNYVLLTTSGAVGGITLALKTWNEPGPLQYKFLFFMNNGKVETTALMKKEIESP